MGNSMLAYHHETSLILPFVVADEASWPQPSNAMPRTLLWFTTNPQVDSAQIDSERSGNQGTLIRFACPPNFDKVIHILPRRVARANGETVT